MRALLSILTLSAALAARCSASVRGMTMIDWVEGNHRFDAPIMISDGRASQATSNALR